MEKIKNVEHQQVYLLVNKANGEVMDEYDNEIQADVDADNIGLDLVEVRAKYPEEDCSEYYQELDEFLAELPA